MRVTLERTKLGQPGAPDDRAVDPAVVSIGVFDGVHRGHQAILERNVARARELGAVPTVVTFRRHPKRLLLGRAPKTLTTLEHRLDLFARAGIEHTAALGFDEALRELSPQAFTEEICVRGLAVRHFVLGFDSRFGRDREGTPQLLRSLGFSVDIVPGVQSQERPISSTAIREAVELGNLEAAEEMLGRAVSVFGRVIHGDALGRKLGFPTANLDLHHELHPPEGVYAVRARLVREGGGVLEGSGQTNLHGVANIGFRPTVMGLRAAQPRIEVYLLDFAEDIYGARLELEFVAKLRGEQRFDGLEELTGQIQRDVETARAILEG